MAYMNQERKAEIAAAVKPILKKYGLKGSLAVRNHSTLVLTIRSGGIDFIKNWNEVVPANSYNASFTPATTDIDVNPYHYDKHFSGKALEALTELFTAMNNGNWDKSDIQSDYFNVGWYVDINIGRWNKPYILEV